MVEDDKKIALALAVRLKAKGYHTIVTHDALGGVSTAVKEKPDLLVLDISMPAGGGFSVAQRLRNRADTAAIPIIFITASKRTDFKKQAAELGAVAYFEKPYDADLLVATIQETLGDHADYHPGTILREV